MNKQKSVYARLNEMIGGKNGKTGTDVSEKDQIFLRKLSRANTRKKDQI